uniref:Uncharacterized protein n=1 Tax=Rhizophora mucronata TaxID=61149 RepID=A0A2P2NF67_RHIMU
MKAYNLILTLYKSLHLCSICCCCTFFLIQTIFPCKRNQNFLQTFFG